MPGKAGLYRHWRVRVKAVPEAATLSCALRQAQDEVLSLRPHGDAILDLLIMSLSKDEGGFAGLSPVSEIGLPLLDEGGHAFLLVLGGEERMEDAALEAHAFG